MNDTKCSFNSTYKSGCRCPGCVLGKSRSDAKSTRRKALRYLGHTFPTDRVSPEEARKIITRIHDTDRITLKEIARTTKHDVKTIRHLVYCRHPFIQRSLHDAVMSAYGDKSSYARNLLPTSLVPVEKYRTLVGSLRAQGWPTSSMVRIIRESGRGSGAFIENISKKKCLTVTSANNLIWLAELIGDRTGPSYSSAARAVRAGYYPQIHYDENWNLIENSIPAKLRSRPAR